MKWDGENARCPKTTFLTHDLRMLAHFPSPGVYPPVCAKDLFPQLGQEVGHIHLEVQALDLLVAHLRYCPLHHVHAGQLYVSLLPARKCRECSLHIIFLDTVRLQGKTDYRWCPSFKGLTTTGSANPAPDFSGTYTSRQRWSLTEAVFQFHKGFHCTDHIGSISGCYLQPLGRWDEADGDGIVISKPLAKIFLQHNPHTKNVAHTFHTQRVMFHVQRVLFHTQSVLFHTQRVLFHTQRVMFHTQRVTFYTEQVMLHAQWIRLVHAQRVLFHAQGVMFQAQTDKGSYFTHKRSCYMHKDSRFMHKGYCFTHKGSCFMHKGSYFMHKKVLGLMY